MSMLKIYFKKNTNRSFRSNGAHCASPILSWHYAVNIKLAIEMGVLYWSKVDVTPKTSRRIRYHSTSGQAAGRLLRHHQQYTYIHNIIANEYWICASWPHFHFIIWAVELCLMFTQKKTYSQNALHAFSYHLVTSDHYDRHRNDEIPDDPRQYIRVRHQMQMFVYVWAVELHEQNEC